VIRQDEGTVALYSQHVADEYGLTEEGILDSVPPPPALLNTKTIPVMIAVWAGWANVLAMLVMNAAWPYIGFLMR
jgi:hypothetical protein